MATQIISTPILTGRDARKVLRQINEKPSKKTIIGTNNLLKILEDYRKK